MRKIYITVIALIAIGFSSQEAHAQQDAQYTQYMYNTLSINPAYAGSRDVLSFVGLYRSQWVGLEGAPRTFTASLHSPIGERVGLGINVTNDEIFIARESYIDIDFSYTIPFDDNGAQLAFGIKGGAHLLDIDSNRAITGPFQNGDGGAEINIDNKFSPQVGLGIYYYTDKFYFGASVPNVLETEHFDDSVNTNSSSTATERANYYFMTGYSYDINSDLKFKPAALVKFVDGAPLQVDVSANFLIKEKVTLGAAYRWSAAFSGMIGFQVTDQLMLGFAYDRETTELQQYNDGSFEVFLRYELFNRKKSLISPRFF